jgi:dihydropteroate synthase
MMKNCLSDIGHRTLVMGILNVTPDSFSDGGLFVNVESAVEHANKMIEDGADIIDIGGESTRPGAEAIPIDVELDRVIPAIATLSKSANICISIDTYKSSVAKIALDNGACMVNDISAMSDPDMAETVAKAGAPIILMHKKGTPKDMQIAPHYDSLIAEITQYLQNKVLMAEKSGISADKIIIDPGIGFGKTVAHNLEILRRLGEFKSLGKPILIGASRKSFIGKILNAKPQGRIFGTVSSCVLAAQSGVKIVRVHDVKEVREALTVAEAILTSSYVEANS